MQRLTSEEAVAPRHLTHHLLPHPSAYAASPRLTRPIASPSPTARAPAAQHVVAVADATLVPVQKSPAQVRREPVAPAASPSPCLRHGAARVVRLPEAVEELGLPHSKISGLTYRIPPPLGRPRERRGVRRRTGGRERMYFTWKIEERDVSHVLYNVRREPTQRDCRPAAAPRRPCCAQLTYLGQLARAV